MLRCGFAVCGGFLQVVDNTVTALSESATGGVSTWRIARKHRPSTLTLGTDC